MKNLSDEMNKRTPTSGVSIIIPAYNEEEAIVSVVTRIYEALKLTKESYEIIVVNDGSTDDTREALEGVRLNIKLISHEQRMGYGAALKTGIKSATFPYIAITDADGTYPNERIGEFYHETVENDLDMIIGARVGKNAKIPFIRKPAKWFLNKLANYLSSTNIPDLNSGFRIMKKEVVGKFMKILPDGFSFTTTITLAMLTNGYSVKYVQIDYFKRKGKSKIKPIQDTLNFFQLIIRTILYFDPLKIFIPLSLFLIMLAFIVLAGSWLFLERVMDVSFGVILMTAIMVMAIGLLADLIDKRMKD